MQKNKNKRFFDCLSWKRQTLPNETIHSMLKYVMHLHDHWNKMMPLTKLSILADLNNDAKFHNYIH
jgi:hypothetical protein